MKNVFLWFLCLFWMGFELYWILSSSFSVLWRKKSSALFMLCFLTPNFFWFFYSFIFSEKCICFLSVFSNVFFLLSRNRFLLCFFSPIFENVKFCVKKRVFRKLRKLAKCWKMSAREKERIHDYLIIILHILERARNEWSLDSDDYQNIRPTLVDVSIEKFTFLIS